MADLSAESLSKWAPYQIVATICEAATRAVEAQVATLDWTDFQKWYRIIETDQVDLFDEIKASCEEEEIQLLLVGSFVYPCSYNGPGMSSEKFRIQKPLLLAASFGSTEILKKMVLMIPEKDIITADCDNTNIIHTIVLALGEAETLVKQVNWDPYITIYKTVMRSISQQGRAFLLMQSNRKGFRPLELAAHSGQLNMFKMIFSEDGVYRFPQSNIGMMTEVLYDVTDYEAWRGSRTLASPLRQFMSSYSKLKIENKTGESQLGVIKENVMVIWQNTKFKMNIPLIVLQMAYRAALLILVVFSTPGLPDGQPKEDIGSLTNNGTNGSVCTYDKISIPAKNIILSGFIMAVISVMWELGLFCWGTFLIYFRKSHSSACVLNPEQNSETLFQKVLFYAVLLYAIAAFPLTNLGFSAPDNIMPLVHTIISSISILLISYGLQILPVVGSYAICVVEMVIVMLSFLPLFTLFLCAYSISFMLTNMTLGICTEDYSKLYAGFYSTFRIMLNLLDPYSFESDDRFHLYPLYFLHVLFVLVVPILLLNFLIALMSNATNAIIDAGDVHFILNRTQVAIKVENETSFFLERIFAWRAKKFFVSKDKRLYIRCFEVPAISQEK